MPPQANQSSSLPPGYTLDSGASNGLPPGYTLDAAAPPQGTTPSAPQASSAGSSIPENYGFTAKNLGKNLWEGAKGAVQGTYALGKDLVQNPNWVEGPNSTLNKFVMQPAAEMEKKAQAAPTMSERAGYKMAEALPFVGPWAASLGEQAGRGDIGGALASGAGAAATMKAVDVAGKNVAEFPTHVNDFLRRANSLAEVAKAGTGIYQGKIQPAILKLQGAMRNEAVGTLSQAIEADKVQSGGQGTISGESAHANAHKLMDQMGYTPNPQVSKLLDRLHNTGPTALLDQTAKGMGFQDAAQMQAKLSPQVYESIARAANGGKPPSAGMSLEDAVKLRSDIGEMASRTGDKQLQRVLWGAYKDFGTDGIAARVKDLQGTTRPFDHYNNEFRAYYDLRKGITGEMMDPLEDRHDSIEKLKKFSQADLTEVKRQMSQYGMDPKQIDQLQENSRSVSAAHDAVSGKYRKSVIRLAISGSGLATGLALATYSVTRGAGIYGLAPLLVASYITNKAMGTPAEMETGRLLRKLKIDPDKWNVRPPAEGPQTFDYNVGGSSPVAPGGSGAPSSPAPAAPSAESDVDMATRRPPPSDKEEASRSYKANMLQKIRNAPDTAEKMRNRFELTNYETRGMGIKERRAEDLENLKTRKAGKPR